MMMRLKYIDPETGAWDGPVCEDCIYLTRVKDRYTCVGDFVHNGATVIGKHYIKPTLMPYETAPDIDGAISAAECPYHDCYGEFVDGKWSKTYDAGVKVPAFSSAKDTAQTCRNCRFCASIVGDLFCTADDDEPWEEVAEGDGCECFEVIDDADE